jgi:hypothetical protein
LSIGTGLNTLANSSDGRDAGDPPNGSGVFSACSMRVKSPWLAAGGGGTGDGAGGGAAGGAAASGAKAGTVAGVEAGAAGA